MSKDDKTPPKNESKAPEPQPVPVPDQQLQVKDTKQFGITGLQKEVLANYLNIQALNQFQLRSYLQLLAETQWKIKADQLTRFGLNLEQNEVTVEFLEPLQPGVAPDAPAGGVEAAPPAPSK